MEDPVKFGNDGEMVLNRHGPGDLLVKDLGGGFPLKHQFVGDMLCEKAFADQQSQGAVPAQVVQGRQGKIAVAAIVEQGIFAPAEPFQYTAHFSEGLGQHQEPQVWRVKLGVDDAQHDGVYVF